MSQSIEMQKNEYPLIDILKFLFAFFVAGLHIPFLESFGANPFYGQLYLALAEGLFPIAVPFYFVASGFFIFRKAGFPNSDPQIVWKSVKKNFLLFGIWSILLIHSSRGALWYLSNLVVTTIILGYLSNKGLSCRGLIVLSSVLFVIGVLFCTYTHIPIFPVNTYLFRLILLFRDFIVPDSWNTLCTSIPFMAVGILFAQNKIKIPAFFALAGCFVSAALVVLELRFLDHSSPNCYLYFSLLPAALFLFAFAKHFRCQRRALFLILRALGNFIYFLHLLVYDYLSFFGEKICNYLNLNMPSTLVRFVLTLVICCIVGLLIYHLAQKDKYKFLRYLYA